MPKYKYKVEQFFTFKRTSPSSIQQDNLLQFSYHSPNGVHDKTPLVYVIEKRRDRFFGLNLHYDANQLVELIDYTNFQVDDFLKEQWLSKYPDKKKLLKEGRKKVPFQRNFVDQKDLKTFSKRIPKQELEEFFIENQNSETFRCYLFKRMNAVSRLTYKV